MSNESNDPVLTALQKACKGLLFISETEAELEPFVWDDGGVLSNDRLLKLAGAAKGTPIETMELPAFFRAVPKENKAKFDALTKVLNENMTEIKVYKLGEVNLARGLCYRPRGSIGPKGDYPIPANVNYDLWSGPALIKPLTRHNFHYDWHWQWDYGNGDIGNQGVHQMDVARWGLGLDRLASSVITYGGRFGYEDAGETPNTEVTILEFGDKTLAFEVRGLNTPDLLGAKIGVIFYGTDGYLVTPFNSSATAFDLQGKVVKTFKGGGDHFGNFLSAVRSRKPQDLKAPILEGHLSAALCHLGNISYRLGELYTAGETADRLKAIKTHEKVQETLDRTIAHLNENHVKLDANTKFRVGDSLPFDSAAEAFTGNEAANKLLTRDYRAPFIVPAAEQV